MRNYPMTLTFLVAYLFYNDGIQTVIASSSIYGEKQLGFETTVLIATILLVQFVAFGGALLFGRLARTHRHPQGRSSVGWWCGCWWSWPRSSSPRRTWRSSWRSPCGIGLVLGGTQALSRSFFSQLIPRGREAEYFSLYQAGERGHELVRHPASSAWSTSGPTPTGRRSSR